MPLEIGAELRPIALVKENVQCFRVRGLRASHLEPVTKPRVPGSDGRASANFRIADNSEDDGDKPVS